MSKLFDQLKNATRSREEKSPGLLLEALQRSQHRDPNTAADQGPSAAPSPVTPGAAAGSVTPGAATPQRPGAQSAQSSYSGIALAILIFAVAVLAWHSAPWRAPTKLKIDPSELKLDRTLDVGRTPPKGTTPPGNPS